MGRLPMLAAMVLAAACISVQARMNGQLAAAFQAPVTAAVWSFGSGLALLTVVLVASARVRGGLGRLVADVRAGRFPWWHALAGVLGGLFVAAQAYAVPLVGVALYTIAVVGGQTGNALAVDRLGMGPAGRQPVTAWRVVAALAAVAGVALAVSGGRSAVGSSVVASGVLLAVVLPAVLSFLSGAANTVQQAVNGRITQRTRVPLATTWLNFATGTACLLFVSAAVGLAGGRVLPESLSAPGWAWLGGLCGIVFITVASVAIRVLGVLLFTLAVLVGQLGSAVALDLVNPATRAGVTLTTYLGVGLTVVAVAVGTGASRRAAPR